MTVDPAATGTRRRLAALTLAVFAALAPTIALAPSSADASPTPSPSPSPSNDDAPAQILVTKLAPRAPLDPAGFFQVRGYVLNRGSQPLHELTVRLRRGDKLSSRSQLAAADSVDQPATTVHVGATPVRTAAQDLAPGARTTFDIRIRVSELQFGGNLPGVYPLKIEARGRFGDTGDIASMGSRLTFIPWFPEGPPHGRVRIAWLWPLVDQPTRGPREVMLDNELATSLARGGRLDRMLRGAADGQTGGCDSPADPPATLPRPAQTTPCRGDAVPMTYAVDPDLLFTADAMAKPYQLRINGSDTKRIDNTAPASSWMQHLRTAAAAADVLSLPYADPDAVALTSPQAGLADEVPLLRELGKRVTSAVLQRAPITSVVWPPTGRLTRRAVEALTSGGATAVVVDPLALPAPVSEPNHTPDTDVGVLPTNTGQPAVLTVDAQLSSLLTPNPTDYPGDRLVEQRWLAETAMISAEEPSVSRTILVAPPRRAEIQPGVAADAIRDSGRLPWLCAVSVASVATGSDACPDEVRTSTRDRPPVELEPPHAGDPALDGVTLRQIRSLRAISTQFTDEVLAEPTSTDAVATTGRLARARARAESSAWRDNRAGGQRMLSELSVDLNDLRGKVHLQVGSGTVTLTSSTGVISVNVVNELQQRVRVGVRLTAGNQARLSTQGTPVTTIRPESSTQISLKVTAQTSGSFPVFAQLIDHNGTNFGTPVTLIVRSTHYGRVALAVTGVAAGVLLVAAGIRIARRALRRAQA